METQLTVHRRSLITGTWVRFEKVLDMKFHDLILDHVSFVYDRYEVLNVDIKNFDKELLRKKNFDYC